MTIKHTLKQWALRCGIEVRRYNAAESPGARMVRQMAVHDIDLVLDVGANDGGYGRLLRDAGYRGQILSFEPLSAAHAALTAAVVGDPGWHVARRGALGDQDGEVMINVAGNSASSSILPMAALHAEAEPRSRYQGQERVAVHRLDGFDHPALRQARSTMLKIDTQGYEMAVLRGAGALLERIRGVQVELSVTSLYDGQALFDEVIGFLQQRGYGLWEVCPAFVDPRSGRMLQFDGVFYRD